MTLAASMDKQRPTNGTVAAEGDSTRRTVLMLSVSESVNVESLTDEELNYRIATCTVQMLAADKLGMKPERRYWWDEEARCLRERNRRPHLVAAREKELGL